MIIFLIASGSDHWILLRNTQGALKKLAFFYGDAVEEISEIVELARLAILHATGKDVVIKEVSMDFKENGDGFAYTNSVTGTIFTGDCEGDILNEMIEKEPRFVDYL